MARLHIGLVLLLFPALVFGQSLADVARQEKERRDNNRERGEKAQVVIGDIGGAGEDGEGPRPAAVGTTAVVEAPPAPPEETSPPVSVNGDSVQQEMEWRRRNGEARERLTEARKRYELLSKLHLSTGSYYVDSNNEPIITSVEQLQSMVAEAQGELDAATAALNQLREDARRAGVPPGWIR
ncbi:MAG: hypothetical protein ACRD1X_13830 [Vicinamibacteria bacterium]